MSHRLEISEENILKLNKSRYQTRKSSMSAPVTRDSIKKAKTVEEKMDLMFDLLFTSNSKVDKVSDDDQSMKNDLEKIKDKAMANENDIKTINDDLKKFDSRLASIETQVLTCNVDGRQTAPRPTWSSDFPPLRGPQTSGETQPIGATANRPQQAQNSSIISNKD